MKFINLTRRTEIGANSYYLEASGHGLVLDSGMHPKFEGEEALPNWKALGDRKLDAIIVSHSHQDHIGTLPVLMRRQPQARVFMTEPTSEIGNALLHNSVNVMTRQREDLGTTLYPLFTHRETDRAADRWQTCALRQPYSLAGERASANEADSITFEFFDAGHVLGSTGILIRAEGRTLFYTGDVNFDDQTIAQAAVFPGEKIDILVMECTRGDTPVPATWSRASEEQRFMGAIQDAFARGGCVLIPVFALGKTQEVLAMLYKLRREKILDFPIYIGGLSAKITEIYDRRAQMGRRQFPRLQLLDELRPFVLNAETIQDARSRPHRVYALSSGMMTVKTLSNIFAQRVVDQPRHSVFFVGYADPASPAGILRNAKPDEEVTLDPDQPSQRVRCHIEQFQFSAHASRESLIAYAERLAPKKILLVHGDPPAVEWMRARLANDLSNSEIIVPTPGVELEL
ncbi:MAG TPA: MBL fold metallo-hydrolase [Chthoniobacterales bacterium]|nr:MBL fold metallo-hydrolase [Chthoniobacterales bacterium]